jgi:vesicle-fusing ATPase
VDTLWRRLLIFIKSKLFQIDDYTSPTLDSLIGKSGIITFGKHVTSILKYGRMLVKHTIDENTRGPVTVLIEGLFVFSFILKSINLGPPNTGKTALAATIAKESDFPFIKIISPESMVGYTESAKCAVIKKTFDDAYKSPRSVILIDSIERLFGVYVCVFVLVVSISSFLDYSPIGPHYSNTVLQRLLVLLKMKPTLEV